MIDPAMDAEISYRQERARELFAAGQNERASLHARLKGAFHRAIERFRASGRGDDRKAVIDALDQLERFEEGR